MRLALRILRWVTYPFLALSMLLFLGMGFAGVFITDFTVENRTGQTITVTPVGTAGEQGWKRPLPTVMLPFPALATLRAGGYPLENGQSVRIRYDMDDINFSEIVVEDAQGRQFQLITDPNPTQNQYHPPRQREFTISDLTQLDPVEPRVAQAAKAAQGPQSGAILLDLLMLAPWPAYYLICRWQRKMGSGKSPAGR
ncbi:MAG: hypothetical protein AMXMBFR13_46790 [Phycisphaerae bacterium]